MDDLASWLRQQLMPGLGRVGLFRLIQHYRTPQAALTDASGCHCVAGLRQPV